MVRARQNLPSLQPNNNNRTIIAITQKPPATNPPYEIISRAPRVWEARNEMVPNVDKYRDARQADSYAQ